MWLPADVLIEDSPEEEFKVWERADLERTLSTENRSVGRREQIAARNAVIRAQHDRGVDLEALMDLHQLSQRQVLRIISEGRST